MNRGAALHWGGARQGALRFTPEPAATGLHKVISGGEAGVDRAALDAALALGYTAGGWCRRGRRALQGRGPERAALRETASSRFPERAALNVRDADATLLVYHGAPDNGTRLTQELALKMGKPVIAVDLADRGGFDQAKAWLAATAPRVLHVAGVGDSHSVGVYARSFAMLVRLLGPARPQPSAG